VDKSFKYELYGILLDQYVRKVMQDRYLTDYASVWKGPKDASGMRDQNASQQYLQDYLKSMKQDNPQQGQFALPNSGMVCAFDPETGHLVMHGAMGSAVIHREDLPALMQGIQGPRPEDVVQPEPIRNNPVVFPQQASSDLSPQLKRRMRNNIRELERWARASAKSFPK
jgi:hypothetical protein